MAWSGLLQSHALFLSHVSLPFSLKRVSHVCLPCISLRGESGKVVKVFHRVHSNGLVRSAAKPCVFSFAFVTTRCVR